MHDCHNTQERLIDLIFDELEPAAAQHLLVEIEPCPLCQSQYQTMLHALRGFDQAAERVTPPEEYWPNYEARLRTRLVEERSSGVWQYLIRWLTGFTLVPTSAAVAAAALLAILLGGWWWMHQSQKIDSDILTADLGKRRIQPSPVEAPNQLNDIAQNGQDDYTPQRKPAEHQRLSRPRHSYRQMSLAPIETPGIGEDMIAEIRSQALTMPFITLDAMEEAHHFERAQLLLRSFRNADDHQAAVDLDFEKLQSRKLLTQNILLRRDAEAKGNLPVEEVLSALEPLLLDIANLSDKPSRGDVQEIKGRIAQQEMIAVLQTHAPQPASYGWDTTEIKLNR